MREIKMNKEKIEYEIGSGNVFKDLGFPNPEEELMKVRFASIIYDIITKRGYSKIEAAKILGINKNELTTLMKGRLTDCTLDHLLSFLGKLDHDIEIVIHKRPPNTPSAGLRISTSVS